MYLVTDPENKMLVFSELDPRSDGFVGDDKCDVLIRVSESDNEWHNGACAPEECLGVSETNEREYRVFQFANECHEQGFCPTGAFGAVVESWKEWKEKWKGSPS